MGNRYLEQFFDLREALPVMARKPRNATLAQRIEKVAEFAARNGPEFVQLIENKQHQNPDYQFLFGGEGHDYYRWVLYCLLAGHPTDPSPGGLKGTSARELLQSVSLPEDVGEAFARHLDNLDGSKDAMRDCQQWFLKHAADAQELAKLMYHFMLHLTVIEKQFDVLHLIDGILRKSKNQCSDSMFEQIAGGLHVVLGGILAKIFLQGSQEEEVYSRLFSLLVGWKDHEIYSRRTVDALEQAMLSGKTELSSQPQPEARSSTFDTEMHDDQRHEDSSRKRRHRSERSEHHTSRKSSTALPPHMSTSHAGGGGQEYGSKSSRMESAVLESRFSGRSRTRAAFDPPPKQLTQTGRVDPFSFPPGLIPNLVAEKKKLSFSYCPISPSDIQKSIYPSMVDPNDPYLKSRLEKFYAELDEYRPGMVREHVESRKRREDEVGEEDLAAEARRRRPVAAYALTEEGKLTSMLPDGSFAGQSSDSMYAGLGANATPKQTEEDKAFDAFRKLRSDVYHHVIPKGPLSSGSGR